MKKLLGIFALTTGAIALTSCSAKMNEEETAINKYVTELFSDMTVAEIDEFCKVGNGNSYNEQHETNCIDFATSVKSYKDSFNYKFEVLGSMNGNSSSGVSAATQNNYKSAIKVTNTLGEVKYYELGVGYVHDGSFGNIGKNLGFSIGHDTVTDLFVEDKEIEGLE